MAEWQVGVTVSTAPVMVVLAGQLRGRRSQSWGRKPVLVAAFRLAVVVMALCALLASVGMAVEIMDAPLCALFVLLRGFIQVIAGFIVADSPELDAATTGLVTGGAILAAGVGRSSPRRSSSHAAADPIGPTQGGRGRRVRRLALLALDAGPAPLFTAMLLIGLGLESRCAAARPDPISW